MIKKYFTAWLLITLFTGSLRAQEFSTAANSNTVLSKKQITAIITTVGEVFKENYVSEDKANEVVDYLLENKKKYFKMTGEALMKQLENDIQGIINDGHFRLTYFGVSSNFNWISDSDDKDGNEDLERMKKEQAIMDARANYGIKELKILEGNVGYMNLASFNHSLEEAKPTIAAAFNFLASADALIIDMRENGGGQPEYVNHVMSYFFEKDNVLISSIYVRNSDKLTEYKSLPQSELAAQKRLNTKLYVLTSPKSGSGGEAFPYHLQSFEKCTVVGETSLGAANGFTPVLLNLGPEVGHLVVSVPDMLITDARTKSNWEKVGVKPDVEIDEAQALDEAHKLALSHLSTLVSETDRTYYDNLIKKIAYKQQTATTSEINPEYEKYVGTYDIRRILIEDGQLKFQRGDGPKFELSPIGEELFELDIELTPKPNIQFVLENGVVKGLNLIRGENVTFSKKE